MSAYRRSPARSKSFPYRRHYRPEWVPPRSPVTALQRATVRNNAPSGQLVGSWTRMRAMCSIKRAPILIRRSHRHRRAVRHQSWRPQRFHRASAAGKLHGHRSWVLAHRLAGKTGTAHPLAQHSVERGRCISCVDCHRISRNQGGSSWQHSTVALLWPRPQLVS
jgi:hypothetical protein